MGHHVDRREYWIIFGVLTALTVLEVGLVYVPGIGKTLLAIGLVGLALTKAALVGFFYMHLKNETKILRWSVAVPLAAPGLYAFVLMAEASWRLL